MKNRYINTKFWDDDFIIELDPIEKLLFLYCLSNTLTNLCGIYEINLRRIAFDTGINKDAISKIFLRFEKAGKMKYNGKWIAIKNFSLHQNYNSNMRKSVSKELTKCPIDFIKWVDSNKLKNGSETLLNGSLHPIKLNEDENKNKDIIKSVIDYLNKESGKDFSLKNSTSNRHINARVNEGFVLDHFKRVIDIKSGQWKLDADMCKYLRPETLFGTKFESYLNEVPKKGASIKPYLKKIAKEYGLSE